MKNFYLPLLLSIGVTALVIYSCALEKESEIPTGVSNIKDPLIDSIAIIADADNNFQVKAYLNDLGNLNILEHGWVWGETTNPTVDKNNKLLLGSLTIDSFSTKISGSGLTLGKLYYLRPFVITGADTLYGPERCSFLGVGFTINTDTEVYQGADVTFTNLSVGNNSYSWDFGDNSTSTLASPTHTFNKKGNIIIRLSATNSGCTVTRDFVLKVIDDPFEGYWVSIPSGSIMMGCTSEQEPCDTMPVPDNGWYAIEIPAHPITVSSFYIGKTEVTQGQWMAVLGNNPSFWYQCGFDCPVETVSWDRIVNEFIPALNRKTGRKNRLPTEAEWEYAARAQTNTIFAGSNNVDSSGWRFYSGAAGPHPVAQKLPNAFGLYDMTGNVWEWVEDDFHESYDGAPSDGSAWNDQPRGTKRMSRGGGWGSGMHRSRIAIRDESTPDYRSDDFGFRLAFTKN